MKKVLSIVFLLISAFAHSQTLYSKAFGNKNDKAIIFLHGGPGYNCANFEFTTAKSLADAGFYVIVYDRRGEGRSLDDNAQFTFKETFSDLKQIYKKYNLKQTSLIGHSFGGIVATLFAKENPKKVESLILVGAPIALQETFKNILTRCEAIYKAKNDSTNLQYIKLLQKADTTSIQYSSFCFAHAMQNGFYTPKSFTDEAKKIYSLFKSDTLLMKYASQMTYNAPQGFLEKEYYTSIDLTEPLKQLKKKKMKIFGLYGKEDGLYSTQQIEQLQSLLGKNQLKYLENCSHNVFIDQQTIFIESIVSYLK